MYAHLSSCVWHCLQLLLPFACVHSRNKLYSQESYQFHSCRHGTAHEGLMLLLFDICFVCGAVYNMHFHNGTQGPLDNFMIQFNKNSFGLAPGSQNVPVPQLGPGSTHSAVLPLVQSPALVSPTAASSLLQVCHVFAMHTFMHLTTLLRTLPAFELKSRKRSCTGWLLDAYVSNAFL